MSHLRHCGLFRIFDSIFKKQKNGCKKVYAFAIISFDK